MTTTTTKTGAQIRRIAIYVRQSLDAQDTGDAVRRQQKTCERWAGERYPDAAIVEIYSDNDTSATKRGVVRKAWLQMIADAKAGEFDLIVAYHLDRLTRSIRDLLPLLDLATVHSVGVTTVSGELDLTTDMGRMVAGILAVVAQAEVDRKGERQVHANSQRAEQGQPTGGGRRAFGYAVDGVTIVKSEATWVRKAYRAFLAGSSLNAIAATLNDAGVTTVAGNRWAHSPVRQLLVNPRYAAIHTYRGVETGTPAAWRGIVSEQTYRAAMAKLSDPSRRTNHTGGERRRLMTGVGRCGVCNDGTTVLGGSGGKDLPLYKCSRSKHLVRALDPVDQFVVREVVERLSRPDAAALLVDVETPDADALMTERLALVTKAEQAAREFATDTTGTITLNMARIIAVETTARIAQIDAELAHTDRERLLGELVRADDKHAVWDRLSLARQQAVIDLLAVVTIGKGKAGGNPLNRYPTFESYNIGIAWKV